MKRQIFTLLLLALSFISFAQNNKLQSLTKLNLEFQGIGLSYEPRLGNSATIDLSAGIGIGGYDIQSGGFTYVVDATNLTAFVSITPKLYYNRSKRLARGKSIDVNSGNYIGFRLKYTSRGIAENTDIRDALLFNVHWGIQRAISNRWTFNTHFGAGYGIDATDLSNSEGSIYPALDVKFSYILNKRKS